jgi:hypothetical protein
MSYKNVQKEENLQGLEFASTSSLQMGRRDSKTVKTEPLVVRPIMSSRNSIVSNGSLTNRPIQTRASLLPNEKNKSLTSMNPSKEDHNSTKNLISKDREIAGFRQQFLILSWKNLILSKRSVCALITEIVAPILTVLILLVLRYFVDSIQYSDQSNTAYNVLDLFPITANTSNTTMLYYYPSNSFIQGIMTQAVTLIKLRKPFFNVTR